MPSDSPEGQLSTGRRHTRRTAHISICAQCCDRMCPEILPRAGIRPTAQRRRVRNIRGSVMKALERIWPGG